MPDSHQSPAGTPSPNPPNDEPSTSTAIAAPTTPTPREGTSKSSSRPKGPTDTFIEGVKDFFFSNFRVLVSQNRRRIKTEGFDLDLTYITDRIIAMGYPADDNEAIYRNSMKHTQRFFELRHKDHYKVFNLRGQYSYDPASFEHRVISFEMTDHHPPRLELMAPFCREVHEWLSAHPQNVVAVHCKAGKGRTGVMICAYLAYCQFYNSTRQNMDYYSIVRTHNNKGVTIPSQRRYVYYYEHLRKTHMNYFPLRVQLVGIYFERPNKKALTSPFRHSISMRVANGDINIVSGKPIHLSSRQWDKEKKAWKNGASAIGPDSFDPKNPDDEEKNVISRRAYGWTMSSANVFLEGDVRVDLYSHSDNVDVSKSDSKKKVGHIWFNTMFTCPGACGSAFVHGDEANPYPDGETSISRKKKEFRTEEEGNPCSPSLSLSPNTQPSTSASISPQKDEIQQDPVSTATTGTTGRPRRERKKFSFASIFSSSNKKEEEVIDPTKLEYPDPPGLDNHCSDESLQRIYRDADMAIPREANREMVRMAHENHIVKDVYHQRLRSVNTSGEPVAPGEKGTPDGSGPHLLERSPGEHVQYYPVVEIDRACKNEKLEDGFKIIIVTRCVGAKHVNSAARFVMKTVAEQKHINLCNFLKAHSHKPYVVNQEDLPKCGAAMTWPPVIQYGQKLKPGVGGEAETLSDEIYKDDPRAKDPDYCRYFYKQRRDSISEFPGTSHTCNLTGARVENVMRTERLDTNTTIRSAAEILGSIGERSMTPMDVENSEFEVPTTCVPIAEAEPELDTSEELEQQLEDEDRRYRIHQQAVTERSETSSDSDEERDEVEPMDETKAVVELEVDERPAEGAEASTSKEKEK